MAGLWQFEPQIVGGKYLVQRRDGSYPTWPFLVLGGRDPAAPIAVRAYAEEAAQFGFDPRFCKDVIRLASDFEEYGKSHGFGSPDAPRPDGFEEDPGIVAIMERVTMTRVASQAMVRLSVCLHCGERHPDGESCRGGA